MFRLLLFIVLTVCVGCGGSSNAPVEEKKQVQVEAPKEAPKADASVAPTPAGAPPETIFFPSEYGNVTYTHQKHYERVNNDCTTCHPSLFPQSREPLNYGKARHRVAEEYQTSCAKCHGISGTAFAAERNCQKCHDMGRPKK